MKDNELSQSQQERLVGQVVRDFESNRRWTWAKRGGIALMFVLSTVAFIWNFARIAGPWTGFGEYVAVVSLKGDMVDGASGSASAVIPALRKAFEDEDAKVVLLEIDSGGGSPLEAERIYTELDSLKQKHAKPLVAVIGTLGASAAYLVAVHCDVVVAGRYSLVGSIGAKTSRYDVHELADRLGVRQETYVSGPLKNMFDPLTAPSKDEHAKAQALVNAMAATFEKEVRSRRAKHLKSSELATGEVWTGEEALALGLIDKLGTVDRVAAEKGLNVERLGPHMRPSLWGGLSSAVSKGVEQGIRALATPAPEVR